MALNGQRPPDHLPVDHIQVAADIETLHHASKKKEEVCYFIIIIIIAIPYMVLGSVFRNFNQSLKSTHRCCVSVPSHLFLDALTYVFCSISKQRYRFCNAVQES